MAVFTDDTVEVSRIGREDSIEDQIAVSDNLEEIAALTSDIAKLQINHDDSVNLSIATESAINAMDIALKNPQDITATDALRVNMEIKGMMVGAGAPDNIINDVSRAEGISVEDATSTPSVVYGLGRESAMDFAKLVLQQVKAFFKAIGVKIKKLYVAAVAFFSNTDKKVTKLIEKYKDRTDMPGAKLSDKQIAAIKTKLAIAGVAGRKLNAKNIDMYVQKVSDITIVKVYNNLINPFSDEKDITAIEATKIDNNYKGLLSFFQGQLLKDSFFGELISATKDLFNIDNKQLTVHFLPVSLTKQSMTVIALTVDESLVTTEAKTEEDIDKMMKSFSLSSKTVTLEKSVVDSMKVDTLGFKDINAILNSMSKFSYDKLKTDVEKMTAEREKSVDTLTKALAKTNEGELSSFKKTVISKIINMNKTTITSISLNYLLGVMGAYSNTMSAMTVFAAAHQEKHNKPASA